MLPVPNSTELCRLHCSALPITTQQLQPWLLCSFFRRRYTGMLRQHAHMYRQAGFQDRAQWYEELNLAPLPTRTASVPEHSNLQPAGQAVNANIANAPEQDM